MRDLDTIHEQIEKERVKVAKLTQQDARAGSHLGFQQKPAIEFAPSHASDDDRDGKGDLRSDAGSEAGSEAGSDAGSEAGSDAGREVGSKPKDAGRDASRDAGSVAGKDLRKALESDKAPLPSKPDVPKLPKVKPAPPKIGANLGDAHFERLRKMLENTAPARARVYTPPPIAEIVEKKYVPIVQLVENAFDCLEAWAIRIKNWKLWTLLMDQYGLQNQFRMPAQGNCPTPPNFRDALHKAVTEQSAKFDNCPVLLCKQHIFHEEVHKVIKPWGCTNFSTPLMELGTTLSTLIRAIPGGKKELEPPAEVLEFIQHPDAAESVYNGTSPVFDAEMSRQLSERISLETIAVKRPFMDRDLLLLKHRTDDAYRLLSDLHAQCNTKSPCGTRLDKVQDVYRAMEWQTALLCAYDSISQILNTFHWVD